MPPHQSVTNVRRHSLESASTWVFLATLIVGIFAFLPSASIPTPVVKSYAIAAGALVALAVYILARLSRGNIILPPFTLIGALWLPVVAYVLSAVFSSGVPFANSLWGTTLETDTLGFMLAVATLGTLAAFIFRREDHYKTFLKTGAYVFGAVVVVQLLTIIVGQFSPNLISPAFSVVGTLDDLGYLMGLGVISVLLTFRFVEFSSRTRTLLLVAGAGGLAVLAVTNSTVVWILVALVSLGLFVESVMRRGPKTADPEMESATVLGDTALDAGEGNNSLVLPLAVLAVALFFLLSGTLGNALAQSLHINVLNVRPSWASTFSVARGAYSTSPVFGSGPSTFGVEWLKHRDPALNSTVFWNTDFVSGIGAIPTSFVTTGVVGAIAWVAFFLMFIVLGLRALVLRAAPDAFTRYVGIVSFVATVYLFTVAVFGLPNAVILALAFVFAGLFISTLRFAANQQQWGVIFSRSPRLGFVIVFSLTILLLGSVVAAYSLVGRYVAISELATAGRLVNAGDFAGADQALQRSNSFAPTSSTYQVQAGIAMARINQIAASTTMPAAAAQKAFQDTLSAGINAAMTATRLSPSNYQAWLVLGNLYAQAVPLQVAGAYESAKSAYDKARALNPTNAQIPFIIAQLEISHKDIKAAKTALKDAITLKQDYVTAIFLLSQLEVQDGNVKDALAASLAAAYFQPNDPNILFQVGVLYAALNDYKNAGLAFLAAVNANPQFANARYFLSAVYAKLGDIPNALQQMQAIADMSAQNATAVADQLTKLKAGTNPFPANLLSVTPAPVAGQ